MTRYSKAIAAFVTALAAVAATQGFEVSEELQAAIITVATTIAVWAIPNRQA